MTPAVTINTGIEEPIAATTTSPSMMVGRAQERIVDAAHDHVDLGCGDRGADPEHDAQHIGQQRSLRPKSRSYGPAPYMIRERTSRVLDVCAKPGACLRHLEFAIGVRER